MSSFSAKCCNAGIWIRRICHACERLFAVWHAHQSVKGKRMTMSETKCVEWIPQLGVEPVPAPKPLDTDLSWLLKKAERWAANQPDPDAARARIRQAKAAFVEAVLLAIAGE